MVVDESGDAQPIYLDIHGGSLLMGGGKACEVMARRMAAQVQMQTWSVDYRMPPDHPYPAALDDVLAVYRVCSTFGHPNRSSWAGVQRVATWLPR